MLLTQIMYVICENQAQIKVRIMQKVKLPKKNKKKKTKKQKQKTKNEQNLMFSKQFQNKFKTIDQLTSF